MYILVRSCVKFISYKCRKYSPKNCLQLNLTICRTNWAHTSFTTLTYSLYLHVHNPSIRKLRKIHELRNRTAKGSKTPGRRRRKGRFIIGSTMTRHFSQTLSTKSISIRPTKRPLCRCIGRVRPFYQEKPKRSLIRHDPVKWIDTALHAALR